MIVSTGLGGRGALSFACDGTKLFAGIGGLGISISTNLGATWTTANNGMPMLHVYSIVVHGSSVNAGGDDIYRSADGGATWTNAGTGLTDHANIMLAVSGSELLAASRREYLEATLGTTAEADGGDRCARAGRAESKLPDAVQSDDDDYLHDTGRRRGSSPSVRCRGSYARGIGKRDEARRSARG